jgi:hypothetical protein
MAAIDKMYLKDYYVFDEFRLWCLIYNPKLLRHFYHWNITYKEWEQWKENYYNTSKEINDGHMQYASTIESLQEYYKKQDYDAPYKQLMNEVIDTLRQNEALKDKEQFIEDATLAIAHLSPKEDKYLLWHCPIEEVREYLIKQCGYKERWYYKLFFKY